MQLIKTKVKLFAKILLLLLLWSATLFMLGGCVANQSNFPPQELSVVSVSSIPETQGDIYGHHYVYCDHCPMSTMKTAS